MDGLKAVQINQSEFKLFLLPMSYYRALFLFSRNAFFFHYFLRLHLYYKPPYISFQCDNPVFFILFLLTSLQSFAQLSLLHMGGCPRWNLWMTWPHSN